jgi:hypothetical protein
VAKKTKCQKMNIENANTNWRFKQVK